MLQAMPPLGSSQQHHSPALIKSLSQIPSLCGAGSLSIMETIEWGHLCPRRLALPLQGVPLKPLPHSRPYLQRSLRQQLLCQHQRLHQMEHSVGLLGARPHSGLIPNCPSLLGSLSCRHHLQSRRRSLLAMVVACQDCLPRPMSRLLPNLPRPIHGVRQAVLGNQHK